MGQSLPGAARDVAATKFAGQLIKIFARFILAFSENEFQCGSIADRFREFAGESANVSAKYAPV